MRTAASPPTWPRTSRSRRPPRRVSRSQEENEKTPPADTGGALPGPNGRSPVAAILAGFAAVGERNDALRLAPR